MQKKKKTNRLKNKNLSCETEMLMTFLKVADNQKILKRKNSQSCNKFIIRKYIAMLLEWEFLFLKLMVEKSKDL